jgi:hypothetical protein
MNISHFLGCFMHSVRLRIEEISTLSFVEVPLLLSLQSDTFKYRKIQEFFRMLFDYIVNFGENLCSVEIS